MGTSANRVAALVFGVIYILYGIFGFFYEVYGGFFSDYAHAGVLIGMFAVNPFSSLVHLVIGAVLFLCGLAGKRAARGANATAGVIYLVVGVVGLFVVHASINVLALNGWDNALHLVSGVILAFLGFRVERPPRPAVA